MKRKLDVYLHQHVVGNLVQDEHGQMMFDYAESWLKNPTAIALVALFAADPKAFQ